MLSISSKQASEKEKQDVIRKQIAQLQAQLGESGDAAVSQSPPRKRPNVNVLAPATPSPKKKRKTVHVSNAARPPFPSASRSTTSRTQRPSKNSEAIQFSKPAPSNLISKLADLRNSNTSTQAESTRSSSFTERPAISSSSLQTEREGARIQARDDRLALIEKLEMGPYEHTASLDDPTFERLEPHSGITLSSREIPHEDFQDYFRGRYYLSPSRLYSVIRLQPNKQGYDVPVDGDFVTIAVVAERGPIRVSKAPVTLGKGDDGPGGSDDEHADMSNGRLGQPEFKKKDKGKAKDALPKKSGRKYVNLKLIDFGSRSSSSATGGKLTIRGDAFLSLLLFEAEVAERIEGEDGKPEMFYKGGSKGAFEKMASLREGSVIALLNPRILKPFQRANDSPHPVTNILAVTPESAQSVLVVGHARDLGICQVVKKDGKPCGSWTDKRVSEVCEYHIQNAVQRQRAGRAEFSIGTSGMANSTRRKPAYDPARQWGLRPESGGLRDDQGGATYVVSGHVVSGSTRAASSLFVSESLGREGQAKAARKATAKEQEKTLKAIVGRDREGMKAVMRAREVGLKDLKTKKAGKSDDKALTRSGEEKVVERRSAYNATMVKRLGFDPVAFAPGHKQGKVSDGDAMKKLQQLASSRSDIKLGPRPGRKLTNVAVPSGKTDQLASSVPHPENIDLNDGWSSSEEELAVLEQTPGGDSDEERLEFPDSDDETGPSARASSRASFSASEGEFADLDDESDLEVRL